MKGVSTRRVDDLVRAFGIDGISKSEVSRICKGLDGEVAAFRSRPIEVEHPYLWVDATYHKVREGGRVVSLATVVAVGVTTDGWRQVLGSDVGPSEDEAFWLAFLRSLVRRGLKGVVLLVSDAHEGLKRAIAKVLHGATWQTCRVHFMRNLLATMPRSVQGPRRLRAHSLRSARPRQRHGPAPQVANALRGRFPAAAELLDEAAEDVLAHMHFPVEHRRHLHSRNTLERLHKEVKRRSMVVGIFPRALLTHPPRRHGPRRAGRRVGRGRAPLLQRGVDGQDRQEGGEATAALLPTVA